jgi:pyruvate/2-oxoacid:ferredoxin oxidoreductase beta subunit/intein/homing endonuclease
VNIRELALDGERLASGHRLCPGCGLSIIARAVMRGTKDHVVVACATGCLEVSTTIYPYTAWNVPWIHNAFENAAATISGVESAYNVMKKKGKIAKEVKFLAFGGDGGTYDIGLQSLSGALERGHNFVYVCVDNEGYMNCLSLDSHIMTEHGLKRITKIKEGDMIYAFNQKDGSLVLKRCTGVFDNGIKEIFELNTLHHTIKVTSNHPFLIVKRNGKAGKNTLVWKKLEELKRGDEVITLKKLDKGKSCEFKKIKLSEKGDYKVNKINDIKLPDKSSPELLEFLGLYLGDGWARTHKAEIGFALPEKKEGRKRLLSLYKKIFGKELDEKDKNYVYIYSINLARFIDSLGFGSGARNKITPSWVFTLPLEEKEAFVKGLMLSDGYKIQESNRYVSASIELLKTLRLLLQTMNYQVGKIHQQTKKKGTFCVYRKLLEDSTYGYICFSRKKQPNKEKYLSQIKQRDYFADNGWFSSERIISIKLVKEEPTLDLRVEGEHNFIADGIVVHNTGIQRSSSTPYGAWTNTSAVGKLHQGKEQFKKDLTAVVAAHHIPYVAQASPHNYMDLLRKAEKAFNAKGPAFINVLSPCVPGWKYPMHLSVKMAKLAVDTCFWPLFEVENDKWTLNYDPGPNKKPMIEWLKLQGRFRHLLKPENAHIIEIIQKNVDERWEQLKKLCQK